jgi:GntR family transcriptional regulator
LVAQVSQSARSVQERLSLLRPTLEKAVAEARQLELDAASALSLFQHLLEGKP